GKLSGRVYDENDKPIGDRPINMSFMSNEMVDGRQLGYSGAIGSARTDEQGRYTFRGFVTLDPQDQLGLAAGANSGQDGVHRINRLPPGYEIHGLNFRHPSNGQTGGRAGNNGNQGGRWQLESRRN